METASICIAVTENYRLANVLRIVHWDSAKMELNHALHALPIVRSVIN